MNPTPDSTEKNEPPMNSGAAPKRCEWTAEERIALRILGRLGYEGDLLRPPFDDDDKSDHLSLIYETLVEEISAGVIGLGMTERPLDELTRAAEAHEITQRKANRGAE